MINLKNTTLVIVILFSILTTVNAQNERISTESSIYDFGKMWTFDYPPVEYLAKTYNFSPDEEWFEDVRLSALRIPGCTASFVSEDGLIMTNNHCSTWHRDKVQKEDENLAETGFYAETMADERKVPNMFAEQLTFIQDVTDEVFSAVDTAKSDEEKVEAKKNKIEELVNYYNEETGLKCQIVSLFNGGKYSIYGYKRFNDVRLVFVPEQKIASFGGDYDNFTYPRYDLDCAFFRVYDDNGKPVNSENFFKFSENGAQKDEVIFSVGNPGRTNRLYTVAQLEYLRDLTYRNAAYSLDAYYNLLEKYKSDYPDKAEEFEKLRTRIGNGQKVYHNIYSGLMNPNLIERKRDFENKIRAKVDADPELKENYGHIWESIASLRDELKPLETKLSVYRPSRRMGAKYFSIAEKIVDFAEQYELPEVQRKPQYISANLDSLKETIYPEEFDTILENIKLEVQLGLYKLNLGDDNDLIKSLMGDKDGKEAVDYALSKSVLSSREKTLELLNKSPKEILNADDPFIQFVQATKDKVAPLSKKVKEIKNTESVLVNMLGKVLFDIYGTKIPPDANFTLRLSDGVLQKFAYNGTVAIEKSTFYGMYNRYYGSDKTYPWDLPERWATPPAGFDLATPYNFISTNDIVGGNSGSAVINQNAEVVGLAFDGNIKSIIGNFIYLPDDNRMVSVASQAIVESLDKVYKAKRIVEELKTGKLSK